MKKSSEIKLALAPMAGITDKAFREICIKWGADITWSEMISAEGIVRNTIKNNKSLALADPTKKEKVGEFWVQIFGSNSQLMSRAAKIIENIIKPHGIDINLGCPVPKAVKSGYGATQLKDIGKTTEIIENIKKSINSPLSAKTRLGLKNAEEIFTFAPKLEEAGLDQLVVHARTHKEMFKTDPHWEAVKKLKNRIRIPIIYSGGIDSPQKAFFYQKNTGCKTMMIGRYAIGNPWIFKQIRKYLEEEKEWRPSEDEIKQTVLEHSRLAYVNSGEHDQVSFRRHFLAYLKHFENKSRLRKRAVEIRSLNEIEEIIKEATLKY